jgi:hypothetical protein
MRPKNACTMTLRQGTFYHVKKILFELYARTKLGCTGIIRFGGPGQPRAENAGMGHTDFRDV